MSVSVRDKFIREQYSSFYASDSWARNFLQMCFLERDLTRKFFIPYDLDSDQLVRIVFFKLSRNAQIYILECIAENNDNFKGDSNEMLEKLLRDIAVNLLPEQIDIKIDCAGLIEHI